jgi:hypothetical protein
VKKWHPQVKDRWPQVACIPGTASHPSVADKKSMKMQFDVF